MVVYYFVKSREVAHSLAAVCYQPAGKPDHVKRPFEPMHCQLNTPLLIKYSNHCLINNRRINQALSPGVDTDCFSTILDSVRVQTTACSRQCIEAGKPLIGSEHPVQVCHNR